MLVNSNCLFANYFAVMNCCFEPPINLASSSTGSMHKASNVGIGAAFTNQNVIIIKPAGVLLTDCSGAEGGGAVDDVAAGAGWWALREKPPLPSV
jgi:hypothetical protein